MPLGNNKIYKHPVHAAAWMAGTLLSFSLMAIGIRELSDEIDTPQMLFIRSIIGLAFIIVMTLLLRKHLTIYTHRLGVHTLRNVFHFGGQYGWFLGITLLPLAEVFALEFTVPIWTLIIATFVLGEKITPRKVVSITLGCVGVIVILQPGLTITNTASLIVLASAICYAVSHTLTKSLSTSDSALSILFYMCLIQLPIGFFLSLSHWVWPTDLQWLWLLIIGLTALSAHYCMVRAMQFAEASTVVTLDFLRLPLITAVGVILYAEQLELALLIGGFIMLAANIINLKQASPIERGQ